MVATSFDVGSGPDGCAGRMLCEKIAFVGCSRHFDQHALWFFLVCGLLVLEPCTVYSSTLCSAAALLYL